MTRDRLRSEGRQPVPDIEVAPWPRWVRYLVIAILFAVVATGLVTLLYDKGILPIAGPFVAMALAPVLLLGRRMWLVRRVRRHAARAVAQLQQLGPAIARERSLTSRASDTALSDAAAQVERALQLFAWGRESEGAAAVDELARTARATWSPGAALTEEVLRLERTAQALTAALCHVQREQRPTAS